MTGKIDDLNIFRIRRELEINCQPVDRSDDQLDDRCLKLQQFFKETFNKNPDFIVSVPGRVNLIGEHVDYSGYGVLPMALEQRVLVAICANGTDKTTLVNMDESYEKAEIGSTFSGCTTPSWYHYFQCGVQGALNHSDSMKYKGMNAAVWGNIPPCAGLSSSSALVSAAAVCMFLMNEPVVTAPSKENMANLCAAAENLIGTQGGGMDQAIAFLAQKGIAKYIQFNPLQCTDVILPSNAVFVIAHSLVEKNKAASNDFNIRVVECRLAAQVMAKKKGLEWRSFRTLKKLQDKLATSMLIDNNILPLCESLLEDRAYNKKEIAELLEVSVEELVDISMSPDTKNVDVFYLRKRACHVFNEAARVLRFKFCCDEFPEEECLEAIGELMNKSHKSLKELYECSHPQLDKLVEISNPYTYGSRLTGAGWGGCIVALAKENKMEELIAALKKDYYSKLGIGDEDLGNYVFVTKPNSGACIYPLNIDQKP